MNPLSVFQGTSLKAHNWWVFLENNTCLKRLTSPDHVSRDLHHSQDTAFKVCVLDFFHNNLYCTSFWVVMWFLSLWWLWNMISSSIPWGWEKTDSATTVRRIRLNDLKDRTALSTASTSWITIIFSSSQRLETKIVYSLESCCVLVMTASRLFLSKCCSELSLNLLQVHGWLKVSPWMHFHDVLTQKREGKYPIMRVMKNNWGWKNEWHTSNEIIDEKDALMFM